MCFKIAHRLLKLLFQLYFTYLNYDHRIQAMIYTTNWIERLQKDFRRVTRMRGAMPNEESVLLLMGKPWIRNRTCGRCLELIWMKRCSLQRRRHRSRNMRPPAATIRSCASSLKWLAPLRPLPTMANQKKTDYICISKESEGPAPDTLDETLPGIGFGPGNRLAFHDFLRISAITTHLN